MMSEMKKIMIEDTEYSYDPEKEIYQRRTRLLQELS